MWRCEKCETMNEDYYDSCSICHYEKNNRTKTEISSSSFYDDWEKEPISRKDFNQNRKSKNVPICSATNAGNPCRMTAGNVNISETKV